MFHTSVSLCSYFYFMRITEKMLSSYIQPDEQLSEGQLLNDHEYSSRDWQQEHSYCFSGAKWERDVNPVQEALVCFDIFCSESAPDWLC